MGTSNKVNLSAKHLVLLIPYEYKVNLSAKHLVLLIPFEYKSIIKVPNMVVSVNLCFHFSKNTIIIGILIILKH